MYEDKTPETIKRDILDAMTSDLDRQEGSFADDMAGPAALELWKMYRSLDAVQPMVWVDETSGVYLELAAAERGIPPRKVGGCACGVCAGAAGGIAGTICGGGQSADDRRRAVFSHRRGGDA